MNISKLSIVKTARNFTGINKKYNNKVTFRGLQEDQFTKSESNKNLSNEEIQAEVKKLNKELKRSLNGPMYNELIKKEEKGWITKEDKELLAVLRGHINETEMKLYYYNIMLSNPKLAFLADNNMTPEQQNEILNQHKEIVRIGEVTQNIKSEINSQVTKKNAAYDNLIKINSPALIRAFGAVEQYNTGKKDRHNNSHQYVDTSLKTYEENIEILKQNANKLLLGKSSCVDTLNTRYGIIKSIATYHIKDIKSLQLKVANSDEYFNTDWYDIDNKDNSDIIKYLQELSQKASTEELSGYVNINKLKKLGYLDIDTNVFKNQIKNNQLKVVSKEVEKKDGTKGQAYYIDVDDYINYKTLSDNKRKSQTSLTFKKLREEYKIDMATIEKAIIDGDIETQKFAIRGDSDPCIDVTDEKNLLFLSRFQMPSNQNDKNDVNDESDKKEANKKNNLSLRMKLAWQLSKKTHDKCKTTITKDVSRALGRQIAYTKYCVELEAIEKEIEKVEKLINDFLATRGYDDCDLVDEKNELLSKKDATLDKLERLHYTKNDKIKISSFYKNFWNDEEIKEEFSLSCKKAAEIISVYMREGIDAIEDEEIKKIILDCVSNNKK